MDKNILKTVALLTAFSASTNLSSAIALAWGDFTDVPDTNGAAGGPYNINNSKGGGSLTFQTTYTQFDTDGTANYFAAGGTTNDTYTWSSDEADALSLIGYRENAYTFSFTNISSPDGSLFLGAGALEDDNLLNISAFNGAGGPVSLIGSTVVGDWQSSGSNGNPDWAPTATGGSLNTAGGGASGTSVLIDLSSRGIARLDFTYTDASGGTVRAGDRWHVDIAGNAAVVPEPSSALLALLAGVCGIARRRRA